MPPLHGVRPYSLSPVLDGRVFLRPSETARGLYIKTRPLSEIVGLDIFESFCDVFRNLREVFLIWVPFFILSKIKNAARSPEEGSGQHKWFVRRFGSEERDLPLDWHIGKNAVLADDVLLAADIDIPALLIGASSMDFRWADV